MKRNVKFLNAAMAGLLATSGASLLRSGSAEAATKGECHGVNGCHGQGACGGQGHGCAGHNKCAGQGWLDLTKAECEAKAKEQKIEATKWSWKGSEEKKPAKKTEPKAEKKS